MVSWIDTSQRNAQTSILSSDFPLFETINQSLTAHGAVHFLTAAPWCASTPQPCCERRAFAIAAEPGWELLPGNFNCTLTTHQKWCRRDQHVELKANSPDVILRVKVDVFFCNRIHGRSEIFYSEIPTEGTMSWFIFLNPTNSLKMYLSNGIPSSASGICTLRGFQASL